MILRSFRMYSDVQWKFLRRNPDFINDCKTIQNLKNLEDFDDVNYYEQAIAFKWSLNQYVSYIEEKLPVGVYFIDKSFIGILSKQDLDLKTNDIEQQIEHTALPYLEQSKINQMLANVTSEDVERSEERYLLICLDLKELNYRTAREDIYQLIESEAKKTNKELLTGNFTSSHEEISRYLRAYDYLAAVIHEIEDKEPGQISLSEMRNYASGAHDIGDSGKLSTLAHKLKDELGMNDKKLLVNSFKKAVDYISLAPNIPFSESKGKTLKK